MKSGPVTLQPLDATPLKNTVILDRFRLKSSFRMLGAVLITSFIISMVVVAIQTRNFSEDYVASGNELTIQVILYSTVIFLFLIKGVVALLKFLAVNKFINLNNLSRVSSGKILARGLPPSIVSFGRAISGAEWPRVRHGVVLNNLGRTVIMYEYAYNSINWLGNYKPYRFSVVTFEMEKSYPHIFLDSRKNGLNRQFYKEQRISLEGDFDNSFDLYAPTEGRVAALSIITPDVMATLMDTASPYDIEINGKVVSIIMPGSVYEATQLSSALRCVVALDKELAHKDITWRSVSDSLGKPMKLKRRLLTFGAAVSIVYIIWLIVYSFLTNSN